MSVTQEDTRETERETTSPFESRWAWKGGAIAGLIATVAMGIVISTMNLSTLRLAIAGLYGQEGSLLAGWIAHLAHGTLFGIIFAFFLADPGVYGVTDWRWKTIVAGTVYGTMLAIVGAGILMPIWLGATGFSTPLSFPNVTTPTLLWHLVYGLVLGGVFPSVKEL